MAQNKNGPIIGLAIFAVLSVVFAVFWYMTASDNGALRAQLANAQNAEQQAKSTVADQIAQLTELKKLIGRGPDEPTGHGDPAPDTVAGGVTRLLNDHAADGSRAIPNLEGAVNQIAAENYQNQYSATHRQVLLTQKAQDLSNTIVSKDGEILTHKQALAKAEEELVKQEAIHSEEMERLEGENRTLRAEKAALEEEFAAYRVNTQLELEDVQRDNDQKRQALVDLRRRLFQKEDPSFSTPDGIVTSVDQPNLRSYINLGSADGLRTGITFSVYKPKNSGVGRRTTEDIKGKIEVVQVLGPHRAEARIVSQETANPIDTDDPVYSPIFQTGQSMEIAVAGRISVDGLDREYFRRLVAASGARISVEVDDEGNFVNSRGQLLDTADAVSRVDSRTRFLVIADIGDDNDSENEDLLTIYEKIRKNTNELKTQAVNHGVYEVGLSTFLEHIGYSRKQLAWTPESQSGFPARLANGARSRSANASYGRRQSSAVVSGAYSERRRPTSVSSGQTSAAYRSN